MITVALLSGGSSSEREVSLRSGQAVQTALETAGYTVRAVDPAPLHSEELLAALEGCDVVFPVLHGAGGEDGVPQAWLQEHGFAFIGADEASSAVCFDKARYKQAVEQFGIPLAPGELVNLETFQQAELAGKPYVLKPNDGGSSVDTFIVRDPAGADMDAITQAFKKYGVLLLEELIEGTEITVAVLDDAALPVIEIIPPEDGEFDYENKYNGKSQELCPPEHVDTTLQKQAQTIALKIHRQLRLRDMSRTDMMIRASDNTLFVLETNTIPGMTDQSLLPKAAAEAGIDMPALVSRLVEVALARRA
ncbi:MAG TPA: D-alanine--D-alanine ligase [Candidatus Saccharimonadales bacterium]|nr:D-alanine--D-alanine ligase [Candidatus Saccharimonadales bacterium]